MEESWVVIFLMVPVIILGIIVYVIATRLREKDEETFEKRKN
jgi:phage shock protein PspC (stress-responsive transcriptional regulator)